MNEGSNMNATYVNSDRFTYDAKREVFVAEVSDLNDVMPSSGFLPEKIIVISSKTGNQALFMAGQAMIDSNENEILAFAYDITPESAARLNVSPTISIILYND